MNANDILTAGVLGRTGPALRDGEGPASAGESPVSLTREAAGLQPVRSVTDGEKAIELIRRWTIARDTAYALRAQRNSELAPPEPEVGFLGEDAETAPSHYAYKAACKERSKATAALRRFGRKLIATEFLPDAQNRA